MNREDWHVCELAQKGVGSRGYSAGRYSTREADVHRFDKMVAERYLGGRRDERDREAARGRLGGAMATTARAEDTRDRILEAAAS